MSQRALLQEADAATEEDHEDTVCAQAPLYPPGGDPAHHQQFPGHQALCGLRAPPPPAHRLSLPRSPHIRVSDVKVQPP